MVLLGRWHKNATIGDIANWKRHQQLDEILIFFFFFTRTASEKSAKFSKNYVMQYAHET